ncbi:putative toxin-antitoxin system toxin component, PIN family [Candidatus Dojkabacteria bacterium]|nr:putative toxin-antitoxin system toxin component, PIN family [Candidatus Dojkabacteria bacterium]
MPSGSRKLRVVIDTNVFISGLNFAGKPGKVLDLFIKDELEVLVSPFILSELERILRNKFEWKDERVIRVLNLITAKSIEVRPRNSLSVIKGKDADNRILECAVEGKADYIISGDRRHILPLKEYSGIEILSPDDFLRLRGSELLE